MPIYTLFVSAGDFDS